MGTVIKVSELCNELVYTGDYLTYTHTHTHNSTMVTQCWPHVYIYALYYFTDNNVLKYYHSFSHPYTNTHSPNDDTRVLKLNSFSFLSVD